MAPRDALYLHNAHRTAHCRYPAAPRKRACGIQTGPAQHPGAQQLTPTNQLRWQRLARQTPWPCMPRPCSQGPPWRPKLASTNQWQPQRRCPTLRCNPIPNGQWHRAPSCCVHCTHALTVAVAKPDLGYATEHCLHDPCTALSRQRPTGAARGTARRNHATGAWPSSEC